MPSRSKIKRSSKNRDDKRNNKRNDKRKIKKSVHGKYTGIVQTAYQVKTLTDAQKQAQAAAAQRLIAAKQADQAAAAKRAKEIQDNANKLKPVPVAVRVPPPTPQISLLKKLGIKKTVKRRGKKTIRRKAKKQ